MSFGNAKHYNGRSGKIMPDQQASKTISARQEKSQMNSKSFSSQWCTSSFDRPPANAGWGGTPSVPNSGGDHNVNWNSQSVHSSVSGWGPPATWSSHGGASVGPTAVTYPTRSSSGNVYLTDHGGWVPPNHPSRAMGGWDSSVMQPGHGPGEWDNALPFYGANAPPSYGANAPQSYGANTPPSYGANAPPSYGANAPPSYGANAPPSYGANAPPSYGANAPPSYGANAPPSYGANAHPPYYTQALPSSRYPPSTSGRPTGASFQMPQQPAATPVASQHRSRFPEPAIGAGPPAMHPPSGPHAPQPRLPATVLPEPGAAGQKPAPAQRLTTDMKVVCGPLSRLAALPSDPRRWLVLLARLEEPPAAGGPRRQFTVREPDGTRTECIFYELERPLPALQAGKWVRCVGRPDARGLFVCVTARSAARQDIGLHRQLQQLALQPPPDNDK